MPELNGYKLDSVAVIKIYGLIFSWFDYTLKDGPKPALLQDKINYEVMGANRWAHAPDLEALKHKKLTFYLGSKKTNNRYLLQPSMTENTKGIIRRINFMDKKDTLTNANYELIDTALRIQKDMVVFESAPFNEATDIAGALSGELQIIISKKDVDLSIQLYEQMADGRYLQLNDDLLRASYAKDRNKRQLLKPGKIEKIALTDKTFFISRRISKGSKLVLALGVNCSAGYEVNYGSGKKVSIETIKDGLQALTIKFMAQSFINLYVN